MPVVFVDDVIHLDSTTTVALKYVECVSYPQSDDAIVDALKGDVKMTLHMISGMKHEISMTFLTETDHRYESTPLSELRSSIYNRWVFLLRDK
jgi:hypothetical protein